VKTDKKEESKSASKVLKLRADEMLMINIGSTSLGGKIVSVKSDTAKI
jgi:translation initiation factor 2 subunit 3